jgi:hypothetical protein
MGYSDTNKKKRITNSIINLQDKLVRLRLSIKSTNHSAMFFSHNKSANNTFSHGLSTKQAESYSLLIHH